MGCFVLSCLIKIINITIKLQAYEKIATYV